MVTYKQICELQSTNFWIFRSNELLVFSLKSQVAYVDTFLKKLPEIHKSFDKPNRKKFLT